MEKVAVKKTESFWDQIHQMEARVMRRAYDISCSKGSSDGQDLDNWLSAERELVRKPEMELREKEGYFEVHVAVTGIDPADLKVEVTEEGLLVRSEPKTEEDEDKGELYASEFQSGSLFRSIDFPKKVDPNKIKAGLSNGLLTVTAPIAEETESRKAEIQAA